MQETWHPVIASVSCCLLLIACDSGPKEPLQEWTTADHNHQSSADGKSAAKPKATAASPTNAPAKPAAPEPDVVALATWRSKCVGCHGTTGMGNGPQAILFKPANLRSAAWQSEADDARIIASIQKGRGKMPGFALPEETVKGLLALIRSFGGATPARTNAAAATTPKSPANTPH